jgi:hypothetical protein
MTRESRTIHACVRAMLYRCNFTCGTPSLDWSCLCLNILYMHDTECIYSHIRTVISMILACTNFRRCARQKPNTSSSMSGCGTSRAFHCIDSTVRISDHRWRHACTAGDVARCSVHLSLFIYVQRGVACHVGPAITCWRRVRDGWSTCAGAVLSVIEIDNIITPGPSFSFMPNANEDFWSSSCFAFGCCKYVSTVVRFALLLIGINHACDDRARATCYYSTFCKAIYTAQRVSITVVTRSSVN